MTKFVVPYPPKELKPNGNRQTHWGKKTSAKKNHKAACYLLALKDKPVLPAGDIYLSVTFHPKTSHKIDRDNAIAAMKWGFDGIALAWGVDDSRFIPIPKIGEPVKGGSVVIEIIDPLGLKII